MKNNLRSETTDLQKNFRKRAFPDFREISRCRKNRDELSVTRWIIQLFFAEIEQSKLIKDELSGRWWV